MENLKIEKEFIYNKIYKRIFEISDRRKLIKKTMTIKIRAEKFLTIKKTIA